ncbi:HIT-like superfamily [Babesia duncani]|uniref:HIT-like superfamily n=1 Tax=Babesia duncani TaxID=323732 RepID=A0AAD9PLA2_9APIC|nr:HIT-like superfamily [Babesia duncani]
MKKCPHCGASNSLGVIKCSKCMEPLTDANIRLRTLDPLCKGANHRKSDNLHQKNIIYRCFDYTILEHPQKCAFVHLSAIPNGTFYDIKNFRKSHIPMLLKMKAKCQAICLNMLKTIIAKEKIVAGNCNLNITDDAETLSKLKELSCKIALGFNYPNAFTHVNMHVILPPIYNFGIFKSPNYYPLQKVLQDLEVFSRVRSYTTLELKKLLETDSHLMEIEKLHDSTRAFFKSLTKNDV